MHKRKLVLNWYKKVVSSLSWHSITSDWFLALDLTGWIVHSCFSVTGMIPVDRKNIELNLKAANSFKLKLFSTNI